MNSLWNKKTHISYEVVSKARKSVLNNATRKSITNLIEIMVQGKRKTQ